MCPIPEYFWNIRQPKQSPTLDIGGAHRAARQSLVAHYFAHRAADDIKHDEGENDIQSGDSPHNDTIGARRASQVTDERQASQQQNPGTES